MNLFITQDGRKTINTAFISKFVISRIAKHYKICVSLLDNNEDVVIGTYNEEIDAAYALCQLECEIKELSCYPHVLSRQKASDDVKYFSSHEDDRSIRKEFYNEAKERLANRSYT